MDRFKPSKVAARWAILDVISARLISCAPKVEKKGIHGGRQRSSNFHPHHTGTPPRICIP